MYNKYIKISIQIFECPKPVAIKKEQYIRIPKKKKKREREVKISSIIQALKITHERTIPAIDSVHGAVAFPEFFFPLLSQCIYH